MRPGVDPIATQFVLQLLETWTNELTLFAAHAHREERMPGECAKKLSDGLCDGPPMQPGEKRSTDYDFTEELGQEAFVAVDQLLGFLRWHGHELGAIALRDREWFARRVAEAADLTSYLAYRASASVGAADKARFDAIQQRCLALFTAARSAAQSVEQPQSGVAYACGAAPIKLWFPRIAVGIGCLMFAAGFFLEWAWLSALCVVPFFCLSYVPRGEEHPDRFFVDRRLGMSELVAGAVMASVGVAVRCPSCGGTLHLREAGRDKQFYACGELGFAVLPDASSYAQPELPYKLLVWRRSEVRETRRRWWDMRPAPPSGRTELIRKADCEASMH